MWSKNFILIFKKQLVNKNIHIKHKYTCTKLGPTIII